MSFLFQMFSSKTVKVEEVRDLHVFFVGFSGSNLICLAQ